MTDSEHEASWLTPGYGEVAHARKVDGDLEVAFDDGDLVRISPSVLGISGPFEVEAEPVLDGAGVRIVTDGEGRDISWMRLRTASDPRFARRMREEDANEARRVAHRLKALREDRGLSQRDVAVIVGMTPPQLSKIESGTFDLRVSTVQALLRAMGATLSDISRPGSPELSQKVMRKRAEEAGVGRDLVDRITTVGSRYQVPELLKRAFNWTTDALASGRMAVPASTGPVQFKTTVHGGDPSTSPLLTLSLTVTQIIRSCITLVTPTTPTPDAVAARAQIADPTGQVTLASMLEWMWDHGVPVIPLHGKGGFCAAVLAVEGGPAVILKETRAHTAYWMFDLAHELGHIALGHIHEHGLIDVDALNPTEVTPGDDQESAANAYALQLLLGDADTLIERVRRECRGSYLRFKGAVATIARDANVNAGLLGVVAATALPDIGEPKDRWGSANNLSLADGPPRPVVRDALKRRLNADVEPELDRLLLLAAVLSD